MQLTISDLRNELAFLEAAARRYRDLIKLYESRGRTNDTQDSQTFLTLPSAVLTTPAPTFKKLKRVHELIQFLESNGPSTHGEILEKSGLSRGTVGSLLWKHKGKIFEKTLEGKWKVMDLYDEP